jgi:hypothetical protein
MWFDILWITFCNQMMASPAKSPPLPHLIKVYRLHCLRLVSILCWQKLWDRKKLNDEHVRSDFLDIESRLCRHNIILMRFQRARFFFKLRSPVSLLMIIVAF